jgi:hypothetical protein
MRVYAIIILCITLAASAWAQTTSAPSDTGNAASQAQTGVRISLNMSDTPLKEAIRVLFHEGQSEDGYILDPALDRPPYDKVRVTMRLQNMDLATALDRLMSAHGLAATYKPGENLAYIGPAPAPKAAMSYQAVPLNVPAQQQLGALRSMPQAATQETVYLVTMSVPPMPVKDAVVMVWPGSPWKFGDDLGRTPMPGARFHQYPREMAAATVVQAAGLIPPVAVGNIVSQRGRSDAASSQQWMPPRAQNTQIFAQNNYGYPAQRPTGAVDNLAYQGGVAPQSGIAIAAYKSKAAGNEWLFTIFSNQALDVDLLERLLTLSGKSYVMGDLSVRPQVRVADVTAEGGKNVQRKSLYYFPPKAVTAQLRDVTLDQALDKLVPPCGLTYRKIGPASNPSYVIEAPQPDQLLMGDQVSPPNRATPTPNPR